MSRSRPATALCGALCLLAGSGAASADVLPTEVVAYFIADHAGLRVLVRVPTSMLSDARLPVVPPGYLDLPNIDASLRAVAGEVVRSLDLTAAGRALPAPTTTIRRVVSMQDPSYATARQAQASMTGPPPPSDTLLYWSEAFIDLQFEFPGPVERLGARLNGLGPAGAPGQTRATYVPPSGVPRTFVVTGPPQRVEFEPAALRVALGMGRRALGHLGTQIQLLLFLLCVSIPRRSPAPAVRVLAALLCTQAAVVFGAHLFPGEMASAPTRFAAELSTAALVVTAAMVNVVGAPSWVPMATASLFGAANGVLLGASLEGSIAVAGSYPCSGLLVHETVLVIGAFLLTAVARPVIHLAYLVPVPEWAVVACLSALPAHEASHVVLSMGRALAALDLTVSNPTLAVVVRYWIVIALGLALAAVTVGAMSSRERWTGAGPASARRRE